MTEPEVNQEEVCPFIGKVISDRETNVLGFRFPISTEIFDIDADWVVNSRGKSVGYIDKDGQIRPGLKDDPAATLAPGKIIGQIKLDKLWVDCEMIGSLRR